MAHRSPALATVGARTASHPYSPTTPIPDMQHPTMQQLLSQLPGNLERFQCRYRSKVCTNVRARKRDGSLHRYCEEHRQRANSNQKIWAQRRMQVIEDRDQPILELASGTPGSGGFHDIDWHQHTGEPIPEFSATDSDCELLWQALGLDNEHDDDDDDVDFGDAPM